MVDVSSQSNKVNVTVSSSGVSSNVNASGDTSHYYSEKAREWAVSSRMVDGVDYSSKYYAEKSNQSALNAQSFAQSSQDTYNQFQSSVTDSLNTIDNKVQEATDNIEIQKQDVITEIQDIATTQKEEIENLSEQEQSKIINLGIDTRADIDLSNLSSVGEKHFLNKSQITNCILGVPQRIKLELVDGALTLKAGSEVIVPNGFEADGTTPKFDYVTIESDLTRQGNINPISIIYYSEGSITHFNTLYVSSGPTAPTLSTQYGFWYDTANNLVKLTNDNGATWTGGKSFPLCIVSSVGLAQGTAIASINQIFNGFGYIGSTVWVDKGVKGLIPNGRNEDGTLRNIEYTTEKIRLRSDYSGTSEFYVCINPTGGGVTGGIGNAGNYVISDTEPQLVNGYWYNPASNILYSSGDSKWYESQRMFFGYVAITNGAVTSFNPKTTFRAVDWNDLNDLLPTGTVISSASTISPLGFLYCNGSAISRTAYAKLFKEIGTTYGTGDGSTTFNLPNYSNYNFVTSATVSVKGNGKGLGLYNGSQYISIHYGMSQAGSVGMNTNGYGKNVGAVQTHAVPTQSYATAGVTTDASKSGLTGTASTAKMNWYIKY